MWPDVQVAPGRPRDKRQIMGLYGPRPVMKNNHLLINEELSFTLSESITTLSFWGGSGVMRLPCARAQLGTVALYRRRMGGSTPHRVG